MLLRSVLDNAVDCPVLPQILCDAQNLVSSSSFFHCLSFFIHNMQVCVFLSCFRRILESIVLYTTCTLNSLKEDTVNLLSIQDGPWRWHNETGRHVRTCTYPPCTLCWKAGAFLPLVSHKLSAGRSAQVLRRKQRNTRKWFCRDSLRLHGHKKESRGQTPLLGSSSVLMTIISPLEN